jgi:hypothetical protein
MKERSSYPMSVEDRDELARELEQFGYREISDPDDADRCRFYEVEKWDAAELHVEALLHASNDLTRRPRGHYTLRQGIRVLDRWPPHGA